MFKWITYFTKLYCVSVFLKDPFLIGQAMGTWNFLITNVVVGIFRRSKNGTSIMYLSCPCKGHVKVRVTMFLNRLGKI